MGAIGGVGVESLLAVKGRRPSPNLADMLEGKQRVAETTPRPFSAYVTEGSTLRHALDSIVTSRTRVAVVATEGQRYAGILTLERISREIVS